MKTVDYTFEQIEIECDECGETMTVCDTTSYRDAQEEMRDCDWFSRCIDGEWADFCCEDCYRKYLSRHTKQTPKWL